VPEAVGDLGVARGRVRHLDPDVHPLRHPDADHLDRTVHADEERTDLVGRADGRREPDPLELAPREVAQSFEADRELGSALV